MKIAIVGKTFTARGTPVDDLTVLPTIEPDPSGRAPSGVHFDRESSGEVTLRIWHEGGFDGSVTIARAAWEEVVKRMAATPVNPGKP